MCTVLASKTIFIDRANSKSARAAFDGAVTEMKRSRQSVYIFVEGTRSYSLTPTLLPFKKGAFHLAVQAQVPMVPTVCENYSHLLIMRGGWKKWRFESGTIRIRVLKKVETKGLDATAVDGLVMDVRGKMMETLEEMGRERAALGRKPVAMKANGKEL
jgi:lysophosphatidate acyltransferase